VERATILPPQSRMGAISAEEREDAIQSSPLLEKYQAPAVEPEEPEAAKPPKYHYQFVNGVWYATPEE